MAKRTKSLGISELIQRVQQDLLKAQSQEPEMFLLDEITLEINFVVSGDINSGFDLGVVELGSAVSEERVQKVTLKLHPIELFKAMEPPMKTLD